MSVDTLRAARPRDTTVPEGSIHVPANLDQCEPLDESGRLRPAKAIGYALMLSTPFWILVVATVWLVF
jgi:hypothetical protein